MERGRYLRHSAQESLIAPRFRFLSSVGDLFAPFSVPLKDASGEDMVVECKPIADGGRGREEGPDAYSLWDVI